MKKILGVMSLIAIFTLSVTQAYAGELDSIDHQVELVTHLDTVAIDTVAFEVPKVFGVFNLIVDESTDASKESLVATNIVSGNSTLSFKLGNSFAEVFLPFEVGLGQKTFNYNFENNSSSNAITNYSVESRYSDAHEPVGWNC